MRSRIVTVLSAIILFFLSYMACADDGDAVFNGTLSFYMPERVSDGICIDCYSPDPNKPDEVVVLPQSIECYCLDENDVYGVHPVKIKIIGAAAFKNCALVRWIVLPDSVEEIWQQAFYGCTSLSEIQFGSELKDIGHSAFQNCTNLQSISFPQKLENISRYAFAKCSALKELTIPNSVTNIGVDAFWDCDGLQSLDASSSVAAIENLAFSSCNNLSSVALSRFVTLKGAPFSSCNNITSVAMLGDHLGYVSNKNLVKVTLIEGTQEIADSAFSKCTELKEIILPDSLVTIGEEAFRECSGLITVSIGSGVKTIGDMAFYSCKNLSSVIIKSGCLEEIGWWAFSDCEKLQSIEIPDNVKRITSAAFTGCTSLKSVHLPSQLESIEEALFENCESLENLNIPSRINRIGDYAFAGCRRLKFGSLILPPGVTEIGWNAFSVCGGLEKITIPTSVKSIGEHAFYGCLNLSEINVEDGNDEYASVEGVLYDKGVNKLIFCPAGRVPDVQIPEGVTEIGEEAFYDCFKIEGITLPITLQTIGYYAFAYCTSLEAIKIPSEVKIIPYGAFVGCSSLANVELTKVEVIENCAFSSCSGLARLTIPASVVSMHEYSLCDCTALQKVVFLGNPPDAPGYGIEGKFDFSSLNGTYSKPFADAWHLVIDMNGLWHGMKMKSEGMKLNPISADWKAGSISLLCEDEDVGEVEHQYSLSYYDKDDSKWYGIDGAQLQQAVEATDENGVIHKYVTFTDPRFSARMHGVGTITYQVVDENGRTAECYARERHCLYIALDSYESGWQSDLSDPQRYASSHLLSVFRKACEQYGKVGGYTKVLSNSEARKQTIISQLNYMANYVAEPGDVVVVYYCGHGSNGLLTCYNVNDFLERSDLSNSLNNFAKGVGLVVVIDACRSASMIQKIVDENDRKGWVVAALDDESSKNDCFSEAFCQDGWLGGMADKRSEGGNEDGYVTFGELAQFAQGRLGENYSVHKQLSSFWNSLVLDNIVAGKVPSQGRVEKMFNWLTKFTTAWTKTYGDVFNAATVLSANGLRTVADCYALGIDPEDPNDDLKIVEFKLVNGKPVIRLNHTKDGSGNSFETRIRILGKKSLSDVDWVEVTDMDQSAFRFFRATVDLP